MSDINYNELLAKLKKQAFVPGEEIGQPPVDPATGLPVDPATGMPIDPATGMPIDPAMLQQMMGGGMPPGAMPPPGAPMDPAAGGMPPGGMPPGMDPAMMDPAMMDPAMMGGMPPGAAPEAPPTEEAPAGSGAPATSDDLAVLEERITGLEDMIEDLVDTIEALGGKKVSDTQAEVAKAPEGAAEAPAAPQVPGPFGSGAAEALSMVNPGAQGNTLKSLMGRLNELQAG